LFHLPQRLVEGAGIGDLEAEWSQALDQLVTVRRGLSKQQQQARAREVLRLAAVAATPIQRSGGGQYDWWLLHAAPL
jgi:hypothetical protein